jgi:type I restriction enzyme S subunit
MSKWSECKLGEQINLKRGYDLPTRLRQDGEIPIFSSSGITGFHNEKMCNGPGVITGRYGTIGQVFFSKTPYWPLNTTLYVQNFKGNDELFIFYFLQQIDWGKYSDKSAVPGVNRNDVHQEEIIIPQVTEQKTIAAVLSSLDNKIDLLNRQNKTLKSMAETLFRQWFIEESQEDWEVCELGDLCETIASGGTPSTKVDTYYNGNVNWYSTKELKDDFLFDSINKITQEGLKNSAAKLFPEDTVIVAIYAAPTVGRLGILGNEGSFNQAACGLVVDKDLCCTEFLYLYLLSERDELNAMASGSAQQNLNVGKIRSYPAFKVPPDLMNKFRSIIKPIFAKIRSNSLQIRNVEKLRDALLPKLMSGEVRVMY